jgi:hypothetical protein
MLEEFIRVRQDRGTYRRYFTDEYFDLFVWYNKKGGRIIGFQLCYDKTGDYRAVTWEKKHGFHHNRIDSGEPCSTGIKQSPILIADGMFDNKKIADLFKRVSGQMEKKLADYIYGKLLEYH